MSFTFVEEVEAFDIERNIWKTINYITDNSKLRIINAGAIQVKSKNIMIFGGMLQPEDDEDDEEHQMVDNG